LLQLVHYPFPHQPSMLVVSFLYVGCTSCQFNFHTTNEMNLRTHQKLSRFVLYLDLNTKLMVVYFLVARPKCHSPQKFDVDLVSNCQPSLLLS
jgi:hypothetical protein